MTAWRLAISSRWLGYLGLTTAFAVACCLLGAWQFARRAEARAEIERVETNYHLPPRPVSEVLPGLDRLDESQKWTPVLLVGEYLQDEQLLVRNRSFAGTPGFEVLAPLLLEDGTVFIVDRGWLPLGNEREFFPDEVPDPPAGQVRVEARLAPGEPELANRTAPDGQVASIHLAGIAATIARPTYTGAYGLISSEDPAAATVPRPEGEPAPDEGPHLSYALQWFLFAILGFVGFGYVVRQEHRMTTADPPRSRGASRPDRAAATDAEIEDAAVERAIASRRP